MSGGPVNAHLNAHVLRCPTRWSDVDENGHINNARLVGYIQEGIYDLFHHHAKAARDSLFPAGFLIARHEIDYLEQLHHQPEPLLVRLMVERLGRSSAQVRVDVCRDPFTYMTARTVVVARDRTSGRSRKLSQPERRFLSDYLTVSSRPTPAQMPPRPAPPVPAQAPQIPQVAPAPQPAPTPQVPRAPQAAAPRSGPPRPTPPRPGPPRPGPGRPAVVLTGTSRHVPAPAHAAAAHTAAVHTAVAHTPKTAPVAPKPSGMPQRRTVPLPSRLPARVLCRA